jgi:hypothetical protein|tara:strand:- start:198 stop:593 length:396 start_codon:yes stop_codon:yes gene_type:complete
MGIWGAISGILGGGTVKSIENIASEWIETDMETAEAKALMVKTLDPNGLMRRDLSARVAMLYTLYLITTLLLLICESFGWGPMNGMQLAVSVATDKITNLFTPITTLFGAIVSASFGVNYANIKKVDKTTQ